MTKTVPCGTAAEQRRGPQAERLRGGERGSSLPSSGLNAGPPSFPGAGDGDRQGGADVQ